MKTSLHNGFRLGLVACSLGLLSSCQSLNLNLPQLGHQPPKASARYPVTEILCLWEPAEGTGLDKLPSRGFAGQILFITSRNQDPVQVDGKVRIYVFDDQGTVEEQQNPIHQFVFDSKSWNGLLRQTNLGAAYQLFIPYTRQGMHEAACSLRVCFESTDGQQQYSKFSKVLLPGSSKPAPAAPDPRPADGIAELLPTGALQVKAAIPDNAVVPAAYTFEDTAKSEAAIRQLQARFDELLVDGPNTAPAQSPNAPPEQSTGRGFRLKPAQSPATDPSDSE